MYSNTGNKREIPVQECNNWQMVQHHFFIAWYHRKTELVMTTIEIARILLAIIVENVAKSWTRMNPDEEFYPTVSVTLTLSVKQAS